MKKPGKPKPKRRGRRGPPQASRPAHAVVTAARASAAGASVQPARAAAIGVGVRERQLVALMLVPFLLVAVFLTYNQYRRLEIGRGFDVAQRAPISPTLSPAASGISEAGPRQVTLNTSPPTSPRIEAPVAVPSPKVAMAPVQPPSVSAPVVPAQTVPAPAVAAAPSAPVAVEITLPATMSYPPPQPVIDVPTPASIPSPQVMARPVAPPPVDVAALDVRPAAGPVPLPAAPQIAAPLPAPATVAPVPAPLVETALQCTPTSAQLASFSAIGRFTRAARQPRLVGVDSETFGRRLANAAVEQTRDLVIYTARYQPMAYPMGDVVAFYGACIDVVIRAYRAVGIDLQEEVQRARGTRGDPNIDHRRTENMRRFFEKHGTSLPITAFPEDYKPGDIVTYHRPFSRVSTSHIAVVTDVLAPSGRPMIVHNRGYGAQLEDALFVDRITGHYRYMGGVLSAQTPSPVSKPVGGEQRAPQATGRLRSPTRVGSSQSGSALTP